MSTLLKCSPSTSPALIVLSSLVNSLAVRSGMEDRRPLRSYAVTPEPAIPRDELQVTDGRVSREYLS